MSDKVNDIEWILSQEESELDHYLSDVTKEQFKKDVQALIRKHTDKKMVQNIIDKLKELL